MIFPKEETQELFLIVLESTPGGRISLALESVPVSYGTIRKWINDDPEFAGKVEDIQLNAREDRLDRAEDVIDSELEGGDNAFQAAKYVLDNQGQARGFGKGRQPGGPLVAIGIMGNYPNDPSTPEEWQAKVIDVKAKQLEEGKKEDGE